MWVLYAGMGFDAAMALVLGGWLAVELFKR